MSIFKTRVKIYNVFIKRLSHATGSLLGSWSMTVLHVKGKFETEPPHCALGWLPQHSPPQHSPPPALTAKVPNPGGLKGKISPSVKLPQSLHFQWLNPSEKRTAFIIQTLQSDNWLYHHCGRPPLLSASYPVCISPWLFPAWTFSPPVLVCELFQDKMRTSHFSSMFSRI